ncbi:DUF2218 domain-containing protein [Citreimonas salinaria]|uniref:2,4-dihydroxyhept-2-ene-1,7-dioic acid aldolase n=1 Tax=Citreimonas salinaria TaxID=321339 RepID=A0A1H3F6N0_9RHOB|nr:DUF2218 domain-containing protein [Citreimonas salinaria]SDX85819.1 hypothetical protein SAMN05444340_101179 [Citreimonas salinaria]
MAETLTDEGRFETPNASRYLQQLCKHFGHKTEVQFDAVSGRVVLGAGVATMAATEDALVVTLAADSAEALEQARHVIDSHLERFAFREKFKTMEWGRPVA